MKVSSAHGSAAEAPEKSDLLAHDVWENSASTASTGELLGTERVQDPVRTPPAVFLGGAVITVLTVMGSVWCLLGFVARLGAAHV